MRGSGQSNIFGVNENFANQPPSTTTVSASTATATNLRNAAAGGGGAPEATTSYATYSSSIGSQCCTTTTTHNTTSSGLNNEASGRTAQTGVGSSRQAQRPNLAGDFRSTDGVRQAFQFESATEQQ